LRYRELVAWIEGSLEYKPPAKEFPDEITVTVPQGREVNIKSDDLMNYQYLILNKPERDVRLVSFELDLVLTAMSREEIPELFKSLRALGLKIAITSINPGVNEWYRDFPEIHGLVDHVYKDIWSVKIQRYAADPDTGLEPGHIMHIGNTIGDSVGDGCMADLHDDGYVTIVSAHQNLVRTANVMNKRYDAVISRLNKDAVYDLILNWVGVSDSSSELERTAGGFMGEITDAEELAGSIKAVLESYVISGKRLIIAIQDGLGGASFKMTQFSQAIARWKEEMIAKFPETEMKDQMRRQLDRIIVTRYRTEEDLAMKLSAEGIEKARDNDNYIFVFTKDRGIGVSARNDYGGSVKPVIVEEEGLFSVEYYPLPEVIALSLTKELLGVSVETLKKGLSLEGVNINDLNIADIRSESAFLVFKLIPRIVPNDTSEFGERFNRLVKFLRSA
jgi:hypothetical protein